MSKERLTAEEILSEYVNFDNVNGNKPVRLLPLTIVDMLDEFAAQEVEAAIAERMPTDEDKAIRKFFIWMVREAKIEVIDAEHAIEMHGFMKEGDMLVPVIGIDDLIAVFRSRMAVNSGEEKGGRNEQLDKMGIR